MKLVKKLISSILVTAMALSVAGCNKNKGESEKNKTNEVVTNVATAPDYSSSTKKLNMYAYVGPTNGKYTLANGMQAYAGEDFRTKERYQEYKDCLAITCSLIGN